MRIIRSDWVPREQPNLSCFTRDLEVAGPQVKRSTQLGSGFLWPGSVTLNPVLVSLPGLQPFQFSYVSSVVVLKLMSQENVSPMLGLKMITFPTVPSFGNPNAHYESKISFAFR